MSDNKCPKCRTTDFESCHSMYCPMRTSDNKPKSIRPVLTEDEQKQLDEYFNFAAMSDNKPFLTEEDADQSTKDNVGEAHYLYERINAYKSGFKTASEKANARIAELESKVKDLERERDELLRLNYSWSLKSIIEKLIEASDILLIEKSYDGLGYENMNHALFHARQFLEQFKQSQK